MVLDGAMVERITVNSDEDRSFMPQITRIIKFANDLSMMMICSSENHKMQFFK